MAGDMASSGTVVGPMQPCLYTPYQLNVQCFDAESIVALLRQTWRDKPGLEAELTWCWVLDYFDSYRSTWKDVEAKTAFGKGRSQLWVL